MKKILFLVIAIVWMSGLVLCLSSQDQNLEQLIIGKWLNKENFTIEFTLDKNYLFQGEVTGTYHFIEDKPFIIVKFEKITKKYEVKFENQDTLLLTEINLNGSTGLKDTLTRVPEE